MKKSKECPKCESLKIGYLAVVPDEADDRGILPSRIGFIEKVRGKWLKVFDTKKVGPLEAYVCTECGYYETYVKSPESIPFAQLAGFRYVNPEAVEQGPFR